MSKHRVGNAFVDLDEALAEVRRALQRAPMPITKGDLFEGIAVVASALAERDWRSRIAVPKTRAGRRGRSRVVRYTFSGATGGKDAGPQWGPVST